MILERGKLPAAIAFCLLLSTSLQSQSVPANRFRAGIVVGLNASQIDGDNDYGYNRLGLQAGVRAMAFLKKNMFLSTGITYSQRGSQDIPFQGNDPAYFKLHLDFIEVPVGFHLLDWYDEEEDYFKMHFVGGFSYGRLFREKRYILPLAPDYIRTVEFNKNDVSFFAEANFFTGKHLGFGFRYTKAMTALVSKANRPSGERRLNSYFLNLNAVYLF